MDKKTVMQELMQWMEETEFMVNKAFIEKVNECLEKEKEQIMDAFDYGYYCASNGTSAEITLDGKMYYNQNYGDGK